MNAIARESVERARDRATTDDMERWENGMMDERTFEWKWVNCEDKGE